MAIIVIGISAILSVHITYALNKNINAAPMIYKHLTKLIYGKSPDTFFNIRLLEYQLHSVTDTGSVGK